MTSAAGGPARLGDGRLRVLDELKGVAILMVVVYHAGGVLHARNLLQGQIGVDIFVILSGIGLALGRTGGGALRFLMRRFRRVYPAYWIVLGAFLLADAHFLGWHFSREDIALHILGIHGLFGSFYEMSINDSFWFVTLIVGLYVLYTPIRPLMGRPGWILALGLFCSLAPALATLAWGWAASFEHLTLRLPGFFIGLLVGQAMRTGRLGLSVTTALLGAVILVGVAVPFAGGSLFDSAGFGLAIMAAYAFLAAPALPAAARSFLRFLGNRSLEIFLIHQPLIREYNIFVHSRLFPGAPESPRALAVGIAVALVATVALSQGLHSLLARFTRSAAAGTPPVTAGTIA